MRFYNSTQFTLLHGDRVAFVVQWGPHARQRTSTFNDVLYGGRLHEERVVLLLRPLRPFVIIFRHFFVMGEHKFPDFAPHAVVSRILQTQLVTPPRDVSLTLKKLAVAPPLLAPYLISVCSDNSFTLLNGVTRVSTVRKAAKLAVYDDTMISVKNHHTPAAVLVEIPLETKSSNGVKIERDCAHRSNFRPLLHQAPDGKPETVPDAELVDEVLGFFDARERIGPLARR
jgi:hypothetical protein